MYLADEYINLYKSIDKLEEFFKISKIEDMCIDVQDKISKNDLFTIFKDEIMYYNNYTEKNLSTDILNIIKEIQKQMIVLDKRVTESNYKFRGFCPDINDWVYGGLIHITSKQYKEEDEIAVDEWYIIDNEGVQFKVDIKKVDQYTGYKDNCGKELYNNDIIKIHSSFFKDFTYVIKWNQDQLRYYLYSLKEEDLNKIGGILEAHLGSLNIEIIDNLHNRK